MSNKEIIKALETIEQDYAAFDTDQTPLVYMRVENAKAILNLINRQKEEISKKDIEIDILIRKKETLSDEVSNLRAEVEALIAGQETLQKALAEKNAEIKKQNILLKDAYETAEAVSANWEVGKSKAIIRFAEEFEKRCIASGIYPAVIKNILKNLVKELTEGSNGE